jgi:hypothetical protein
MKIILSIPKITSRAIRDNKGIIDSVIISLLYALKLDGKNIAIIEYIEGFTKEKVMPYPKKRFRYT